MLGSLLDQDEIEEFMAEADAVIMMLIMWWQIVFLCVMEKWPKMLPTEGSQFWLYALGALTQIFLIIKVYVNSQTWTHWCWKIQAVSPGRERENGLRGICANAPATLDISKVTAIWAFDARFGTLRGRSSRPLHFVSSFSYVCAFSTWNTLPSIFIFDPVNWGLVSLLRGQVSKDFPQTW